MVITAIICLGLVSIGSLILLAWRESSHAKELRELATIALTQKHSTTVDDSVRAVALTREALAIPTSKVEIPTYGKVEYDEDKKATGFVTSDGVKLDFATPMPQEMLSSIPDNRRTYR